MILRNIQKLPNLTYKKKQPSNIYFMITYDDKLSLYQQAKEAYYNGNPIMGDVEFDELEKELGLENKGSVGTLRNPTYTVKHPFIMGSLSKVQIHEDKNHVINWKEYLNDAHSYFGNSEVIVSPKYDGCSFEMIFNRDLDGQFVIGDISGRGDGYYGKDLFPFLKKKAAKIGSNLNVYGVPVDSDTFIFRGEILINKEIFEKKYWSGRPNSTGETSLYARDFVNPRSFVAGVIGNDYDPSNKELQERINDLSIVIYYIAYKDARVSSSDDEYAAYIDTEDPIDTIKELDFTSFENIISEEFLPSSNAYVVTNLEDEDKFKDIYYFFDNYRKFKCPYNMDGFVIKPIAENRIANITDPRPSDCVAIKFLPMVVETEVTDIEWNRGKSGEYIPNVRFKSVTMDGKQVSKANGFNYGYIKENNIVPGKKLTISLAGDIIPYIYKIDSEIVNKEIEIPINTEIVDDIHLIAKRSEREIENDSLYYSILSLNVPGIGSELAKQIVVQERQKRENPEILNEFFGTEYMDNSPFPTNVLLLTPDEIKENIGGKNGQKISKAFKDICDAISLKEIIQSCNFKLCGNKVSEQCANVILNKKYDFTSMASEGYNWVFDENSTNYQKIMNILKHIGRPLSYFKTEDDEVQESKIPIIMTGEPTTAATKKEFLKQHPEYRETGSWKEVQIVFTNDMNSNTGKMKKAREKNIEIRLY